MLIVGKDTITKNSLVMKLWNCSQNVSNKTNIVIINLVSKTIQDLTIKSKNIPIN